MDENKELIKHEQKSVAMKNIDFTQGIIPRDYEDTLRMALIIYKSGLAPKSLDTMEKVAVAMMMAMESGLPVITGIQNIAVINGRAGIWGDVALALVRRSGLLEEFKEWSEGERKTPSWTFFCTVKRKGADSVTGTFSWQEAIEAGLSNASSPSPWAKWTNRMMQFKARNFPLRDQFGDVLRGMKIAEDLYDIVDMQQTKEGTFEQGIKASPPPEGTDIYAPTEDAVVAQPEATPPPEPPASPVPTPGETFWNAVKSARGNYEPTIIKYLRKVTMFRETEPDIYGMLKEKWTKQISKPWPIIENVTKEDDNPFEPPFEDLGEDPRTDPKGFDYLQEMTALKKEIIAIDGDEGEYRQALSVYGAKKSPDVPESDRADIVKDLKKYIDGRKVDGQPEED